MGLPVGGELRGFLGVRVETVGGLLRLGPPKHYIGGVHCSEFVSSGHKQYTCTPNSPQTVHVAIGRSGHKQYTAVPIRSSGVATNSTHVTHEVLAAND